MKTKSCHCCSGTGKEIDNLSAGTEMRSLREKAGLSQAEVARRLDFGAPYLCDLELGRRNWSEELIGRYRKACL